MNVRSVIIASTVVVGGLLGSKIVYNAMFNKEESGIIAEYEGKIKRNKKFDTRGLKKREAQPKEDRIDERKQRKVKEMPAVPSVKRSKAVSEASEKIDWKKEEIAEDVYEGLSDRLEKSSIYNAPFRGSVDEAVNPYFINPDKTNKVQNNRKARVASNRPAEIDNVLNLGKEIKGTHHAQEGHAYSKRGISEDIEGGKKNEAIQRQEVRQKEGSEKEDLKQEVNQKKEAIMEDKKEDREPIKPDEDSKKKERERLIEKQKKDGERKRKEGEDRKRDQKENEPLGHFGGSDNKGEDLKHDNNRGNDLNGNNSHDIGTADNDNKSKIEIEVEKDKQQPKAYDIKKVYKEEFGAEGDLSLRGVNVDSTGSPKIEDDKSKLKNKLLKRSISSKNLSSIPFNEINHSSNRIENVKGYIVRKGEKFTTISFEKVSLSQDQLKEAFDGLGKNNKIVIEIKGEKNGNNAQFVKNLLNVIYTSEKNQSVRPFYVYLKSKADVQRFSEDANAFNRSKCIEGVPTIFSIQQVAEDKVKELGLEVVPGCILLELKLDKNNDDFINNLAVVFRNVSQLDEDGIDALLRDPDEDDSDRDFFCIYRWCYRRV